MAPGDTLFFQAGTRDYLLIRNFRGEQGKPLVFINLDDVVNINTDHHFGISMVNCRYIKFTGTGSGNNFYGFRISRVAGGGAIGVTGMSSDVEIDHFFIENVPIGGIYAKTDPDCSFTNTRDKFTQYNTLIHDNRIENVGNEGMYIGSTKYFGQVVDCNGVDTLLLPSLLDGVRIYNNIISYTGWDGIQVSSAFSNCQIYDNLITYDSQDEHFGQASGIIIGGGSRCDCFNNYISDGKGDGIESHGLGDYSIFNNIIVNAGKSYFPLDSAKMKYGIYVTDVSAITGESFNILFNDIINPKSDGIRFSSINSRNSILASNIIINPGNYDYYEHSHTGFHGEDAYIMIPDDSAEVVLKSNYTARNSDHAGLAPNYTLLPGSPLINSGYGDNLGIFFDFYRHDRPFDGAFDIGAHEFNPAYLALSEIQTSTAPMIKVYPNPVTDSFVLLFNLDVAAPVRLKIYNLQGNLEKLIDYGMLPAGLHLKKVQADALPNGIHLFTFFTLKNSQSGRFIKQN